MVIADSGFWLALANPKDQHHSIANYTIKVLKEGLITTWPVMTETCYLLQSRIGSRATDNFIGLFESGFFSVFDLNVNFAKRIRLLMLDYAKLPMDLADASLVILAEHLGHGRILSTDQRDFKTYRWKSTKPFENLLLQ